MAELKPCPFCGGPAEYKELRSDPDGDSRGYVRCEHGCCEQVYVCSKDGAIEDWNRRAEDGN